LAKEKKNEHIFHRENGWAVKAAGSERPSSIFETRGEAVDYARELAKKHNVCMVVHDEEGKFEEALVHSEDGKIESKECSPEDHPGILEVFFMNLKMNFNRL